MKKQNIYKKARGQSGMTQERAAELLLISTDTLSNYERGIYKPPEEIVREMIILYNFNQLAMDYFFDSPLREYLPVVEGKTVKDAVLNFMDILNQFDRETLNKMISLANEKEFNDKEFSNNFDSKVTDLINAATELRFCKSEEVKR